MINYTIKKGNAPKIQLIALSESTLLTTNNNSTKAIKATYNKGTGVLKSTGGCPLKYRLGVLKSTGSNSRRTKEPIKVTKGETKQGNQGRNQAREPSKQRNQGSKGCNVKLGKLLGVNK